MTRAPSVSVVVPVLNGASTIGDLLNALVHQSGAPRDTEIIIVDNGSTDGTREIIRKFNVTLLEESKRGPAAARNRGLRHATGEIIAHTDSDTLPARTWLKEITAPFADPHVILVGGQTLSFPPQTPAERYIARYTLYSTREHMTTPKFPFVAGVNMAVRRQHALAVRGWPEDLMTAEDVDFCHRLLSTFRAEIVYQPSALVFHRNRKTDAALCRQAFGYGEGVGHMYLRYPDVLPWGVTQWLRVTHALALRALRLRLLRLGRRFRWGSAEKEEFARYYWLWTWHFWRGFFSYRRHRDYRQR